MMNSSHLNKKLRRHQRSQSVVTRFCRLRQVSFQPQALHLRDLRGVVIGLREVLLRVNPLPRMNLLSLLFHSPNRPRPWNLAWSRNLRQSLICCSSLTSNWPRIKKSSRWKRSRMPFPSLASRSLTCRVKSVMMRMCQSQVRSRHCMSRMWN